MTEYEEMKKRLINEVFINDREYKKSELQTFSIDQLRILLSALISFNRYLRNSHINFISFTRSLRKDD